jgi:hypothetical protein
MMLGAKKCDRYKKNLEDAIEEKTIGVIANYSESVTAASPKQHWLHSSSTNMVSRR